MATYIYKAATGALVMWCADDAIPTPDSDALAANGDVKVVGLPPLDATHIWDTSTRTVISGSPPKVTLVQTSKWIMRFTPVEFQAIMASTDATVQQFVYALNHTIILDTSDPVMVTGVNDLVTKSLLDPSRAPTILA